MIQHQLHYQQQHQRPGGAMTVLEHMVAIQREQPGNGIGAQIQHDSPATGRQPQGLVDVRKRHAIDQITHNSQREHEEQSGTDVMWFGFQIAEGQHQYREDRKQLCAEE